MCATLKELGIGNLLREVQFLVHEERGSWFFLVKAKFIDVAIMNAGLSYEVRVLHAAADGIGPALILSAPKGAAQYLINVPEGFARLALEHKLRPSARLSCVMLTSLLPQSAGGLGGLFLRLAQDGHGQVQIVGPRGMAKLGHSFRHIFRWRHPKVIMSECRTSGKVPVFEDEHIAIVPIVIGDLHLGCPWCQYGSIANAEEDPLPSQFHSTKSRSSSDSDSSDSGPVSHNNVISSSDDDEVCWLPGRSGEEEDHATSSSGRSNSEGACNCKQGIHGLEKKLRKRRCKNVSSKNVPLFSDLDIIFASGNNRLKDRKNVALSHLRKACGSTSQVDTFQCAYTLGVRKSRSSAEVLDVPSATTTTTRNTEHHDKVASQDTCSQGERLISSVDIPGRCPLSGEISSDLQPGGSYEWLIDNATRNDLPDSPDDANPVYVRNPCGTLIHVSDTLVQSQQQKSMTDDSCSSAVLGFVCFLKKLGTGIILVDCSSPAQFESLCAHSILRCVQGHVQGAASWDAGNGATSQVCQAGNGGSGHHSVAAIIHLSPYSLPKLAESHAGGPEEKLEGPPQIVVQRSKSEFGFCSSLETVAKLNTINKKMFPLPFDVAPQSNVTATEFMNTTQAKEVEVSLLSRIVFEKGLTGVHMSVDHSECLKVIDTVKIQKELLQSKPQLQAATLGEGKQQSSLPSSLNISKPSLTSNQMAAATLKERLKKQRKVVIPCTTILNGYDAQVTGEPLKLPAEDLRTLHRDGGSEFELVFLGTGSAEPSKFRGSSGILLQTGSKHWMLLDAGEGSLGQIVRKYGETGACEVLKTLECVWLSHKHADHVLGIMSLIHAQPVGAPVLIVIGPSAVKKWIQEVVDVWTARGHPYPNFHFVLCDSFSGGNIGHLEGEVDPSRGDLLKMLQRLELRNLRSVVVDHCHESYGLIVHSQRGWSVVYSGDTRPCHRLIQAGAGCTLLIHEATFEDNLADHAKRKRHSTVLEALDVGFRMAAQYIVLTHFSQRYPQVVTLNAARHKNVCLAFDGMVVCSSELEKLGQTLPLLALIFSHLERLETQPLIPSSNEDAGIACITSTVITKPNSINQMLPGSVEDDIARPSHILQSRIKKMKGFRTTFEPMESIKTIPSRPGLSKPIFSKPKSSQHIRFATSDSDSDISDTNLEPPRHIRWYGSSYTAG